MELPEVNHNNNSIFGNRFAVSKVTSFHPEESIHDSTLNLLGAESNFDDDEVFESGSTKFNQSSSGMSFTRLSASSQERPNKRQTKLKIFLASLACVIVVVVVLVWHFYGSTDEVFLNDGNITLAKVDASTKILTVFDVKKNPLVTIALDSEERVSGDLTDFKACTSAYENSHCMKWEGSNSSLTLSAQQFGSQSDADAMHCLKISWKANGIHVPKDCIHIVNDLPDKPNVWFSGYSYILWYSAATAGRSKEVSPDLCMPYIPGGRSALDALGTVLPNQGGSIVEPIVYSSHGAAIKFSTHHVIRVCQGFSSETPKLCLEPIFDSVNENRNKDGYYLDYMTCVGDSLPGVYQQMMKRFVKPSMENIEDLQPPFSNMANDGVFYEDSVPSNTENFRLVNVSNQPFLIDQCSFLVEKPLWNFVYRHDELDFEKIEKHLEKLQRIGGTCHFKNITQIYTNMGDYTLQSGKQNASKNFLTTARKFGLEVMLPITSFVNYDAATFKNGALNSFFVSNYETGAPLLISFKYGEKFLYPAIVDTTFPDATDWLRDITNHLKTTQNVTYFQFYNGQSTWLPRPIYDLNTPLHNEGHFSTLFSEMALSISRCSVSDVAYDSQILNQFVLLSPARSMRATLAAVLGAGLAGYPFVIPNLPASLYEASQVLDSNSLQYGIIRWIEMVSFFPVVHIPWDFEALTNMNISIPFLINKTEYFLKIRNSDDVMPKIKAAFMEAELNRSRPVIAPMWMAPGALNPDASNVERILLLNDQFMIGEDLIVAPIVESVANANRTIYFPPGKWKDVVLHRETDATKAGKWLTHYPVDLYHIPVFVRTDDVM